MTKNIQQFVPLSPAALHILLALAGEDLHGYGIMQEIARQSGGRVKIGPGTLYDCLKRLVGQGLVEQTTRQSSEPRRRYYRLRALGRSVLAAEAERLDGVLRDARARLRVAKLRRA